MSIKWKLFLIVIISMFATAGAGVYFSQNQQATQGFEAKNEPTQQVALTQISQDIETYPERAHYQTIPLNSINSMLQGSDPATLALRAFDDRASSLGTRKVEVSYPQRNQALVTITQIPQSDVVSTVKYRVAMTTFGRSLLVTSPPVWEIVWAGSQVQCHTGNRAHKKLSQNCQKKDEI